MINIQWSCNDEKNSNAATFKEHYDEKNSNAATFKEHYCETTVFWEVHSERALVSAKSFSRALFSIKWISLIRL